MKYIRHALVLIVSYFATSSTLFGKEVTQELKMMLGKIEGINGVFKSIEPLLGQGGSLINEVYLVRTDQGEKFVFTVGNINWKNEKTLNEVQALKFFDQFTSIPVPKVLAYEPTAHRN